VGGRQRRGHECPDVFSTDAGDPECPCGAWHGFVGASGVKTFTDETLPSGSAPVTYQITAVRSTSRGNPAQFTVNFGIGGPGLTIASITEGSNVKLAA